MKKLLSIGVVCLAGSSLWATDPALTIYNQNFAVVRDTVHLDLKAGVNEVDYSDATMHLEPDSVVLRDPKGKRSLQILEQNFRADPISQALLLNYYEGKTIDFETTSQTGVTRTIRGKIVRSGYVFHQQTNPFDQDYYQSQAAFSSPSGGGQPIIEVNGQLMFRLPGEPLFPALPNDSILKPTLAWQLRTDASGPLNAELSYITGGMRWQAAYNLVLPEDGDTLDLVGWVTIDNQSGKSFPEAKIKLMAGDVNKIRNLSQRAMFAGQMDKLGDAVATVSEKAFDEFHLYTLARPTTLLDRETKQVEFVRAGGIKSEPIYVYDGMRETRFGALDFENIRNFRDYGTELNTKVGVMREFKNSADNHLGLPLPKGRLRFYRRDADGQMEFIGENTIDHTPKDELVRVKTGDAFDLVGERKRTNFHSDNRAHEMDETFEIKLRNHKKKPVDIHVVEHLYRSDTWQVTEKSQDFTKKDAQTIEFLVHAQPDAEETVTYTVHYTW